MVKAATYRKQIVQVSLFMLIVMAVLSFSFFVQAKEVPASFADEARIPPALTSEEDTTMLPLIEIESIEKALFAQTGKASYYGRKFHGRKTASGERFDRNRYTAAHKTLPFNSLVKVTNLDNNKSVLVRINDRGPFVRGRVIDLSTNAAEFLEITLGKVKVEKFVPLPHRIKNGESYAFTEELEPVKISGDYSVIEESSDFTSILNVWDEVKSDSTDSFLVISSVGDNDDEAEYKFSLVTVSPSTSKKIALAK